MKALVNKATNEAFKQLLNAHGIGIGEHTESQAVANLAKIAAMGKEIWNSTESRVTRFSSELTPFLYPDNSFIKLSRNDAAFAAFGEVTETPEAATGPVVTKGRIYSTGLANNAGVSAQSVKIRKNGKKTWTMEYFHTTPTVLSGQELTAEVAYNTRQDMLQAHANELNEATANYTAVEWAGGAVGVARTTSTTQGADNLFVFSSGAARPNPVVGTSGNVKKLALADIKAVKNALVKQQILNGSSSGRLFFLPTPEMYNDLLGIPEFVDYEKTGRESRLLMGEIGTIMNIIVLNPRFREDWGANVIYSYTALSGVNTNLTKIADDAASGSSMISGGLIWAENLVRRAEGAALVFPWMNSPTYFGDVYAVEQRYAADKLRSDGKGIVMLMENPF